MKYLIALFCALLICAAAYAPIYTDASLTGDGSAGNPLSVVGASVVTTISPAQITTDQDNYAPTGIGKATYVIISGDSDIQAITGIVDSTAGVLRKTIINGGSNTIYLPSEHPDSDAAHRFVGLSSDFKLYPGKSCEIFYDLSASRWRILSAEDENGRTGVFYEASAGSITAADWGDLAFSSSLGAAASLASTATLPAAFELSTSTSAAGISRVAFSKTSTSFSAFGSAYLYAESTISIPTLSDGTNAYTVHVRLSPSFVTALTGANSIGIKYTHSANSGKWQLYSFNNAAAETNSDGVVTVATATIYKVRIELDKSNTELRAYINDVYVGKIASTVNAGVACANVGIVKSLGTTARTLNVHSFSAGAIYK